jgi:hypothetical protein
MAVESARRAAGSRGTSHSRNTRSRDAVFIPSRARGAVLAGVGTACCALARPRRICRLLKKGGTKKGRRRVGED